MDIENIASKWETQLWSIIDSYFKNTDNYLCKNQLDSYNRFIDINIPKTVRQFNPLILSYNKNTVTDEFTYEVRVTVGGSIKKSETTDSTSISNKVLLIDSDDNMTFVDNAEVINDANNIFVGKPIIQELKRDSDQTTMNQKPLYPNEARLKNITYRAELRTDIIVEYINKSADQPRVIRHFKNIMLGHIPIMLQSKICSLYGMKYDTLRLMGECEYDHGGYFIIDGKEKVIIAQERQIENKIYIAKLKENDEKFAVKAEVRSAPENRFQPARITNLLVGRNNIKDKVVKDCIYAVIPNIQKEIPLFTLFRALGVISDHEILQMIIGSFDNNLSQRMLDFLFPTINNIKYDSDEDETKMDNRPEIISNKIEALNYIASHIDEKFIGKNSTDAEKMAYLDVILKDYFIPHIGHNLIEKAQYLAYMTRELLETVLDVKPYTDRDSYMYKRVDLAGYMISSIFRDLYFRVKNRLVEVCNINYNKRDVENFWSNNDEDIVFWSKLPKDLPDIDKFKKINLYRLIGNDNETSAIIATRKMIDPKIMDEGFIYAFKMAWGLKNAPGNKEGVVQDLARLSYVGFVSHLRRINTPLSSSAKVRPPHSLHTSSWGIMCPSETPDGGNIGLRKNLAIFAVISAGSNSMNLLKCLYNHGMEGVLQVDSEMYKYTRVMLNERVVGYVREPIQFYKTLKLLKRNAIINIYTSITFNIYSNIIKVNTDSGRGIRPVLLVGSNNKLDIFKTLYNGKTVIQSLIDGEINWNHLIGGFRKTELSLPFNDQDETYYMDEELTLAELEQNAGVIEYIDKDEEDKSMVALTINDLAYKEYPYDYCEIHPSLILGLLANCIPFIEMNQGPRHLYAVGQSKQALGLYASNFRNRMDTKGQIMYYPQKSIVKNRLERYLFTNELPNGINAIVAIGCFTGYNQEDSIIFNKASVERGLFRTAKFRTYSAREEVENNKIRERIMKPDPQYTRNLKSGNYTKLDENGIIIEGSKINHNDILIGKCVVTSEKINDNPVYLDNSDFVRLNEDGFVDKVYSNIGNDDQRYVKVRIRKDKKPELGDKFCSRFGQKGTVGMLMEPFNMPFSKKGIQPDLIVNAHAFPSRMTIAQFLEVVLGKACIEKGIFSEVAAFSKVDTETISKALEMVGFEGLGNEVLYNGMTGEMMHVNYFIGPTYYQRLTHQVSDKYQSRDDGLKTALTHQPVGGRSLGGGGRIGEMERDALLSHGVTGFLQESFMQRSDKDSIMISKNSGVISVYNPDKGIYRDFMHDEITQWYSESNKQVMKRVTDPQMYIPKFAKLEVPYAFKLFLQEVEGMGISMKFITESSYTKWDNELICPSDKMLMDMLDIENQQFRVEHIRNKVYWKYIEELLERNLEPSNRQVAKHIINDIKIRKYLAISYHKTNFTLDYVLNNMNKYNVARANERVTDIVSLLPSGHTVNSFIDIGASEGSITKAIAEHFNVSKENAFGLDVEVSKYVTDDVLDRVQMITYVSRNNTGLPDESVDLVTLHEVFHHVDKSDRLSLINEIYRILKPGGYVIFREHDLPNENRKEFIEFLQLVHGIYIMMKDETYNEYYAHYFSYDYLNSFLTNAKFKFIKKTDINIKKLQKVFSCIFQKPISDDKVAIVSDIDKPIHNIKNVYDINYNIASDNIDVIELKKLPETYITQISDLGMLYMYKHKWHLTNDETIKQLKMPKQDDSKASDITETSKYSSYIRSFFPTKQVGLATTSLKLVPSSFKSTSDHKTAMEMTKHIVNDIMNNTNYKESDINEFSITDGTSNVGGNSFPFMMNFKHVHCIEYDNETCKALRHNMEKLLTQCYKLKSDNPYSSIKCKYLTVRNGDFTKVYKQYNTNVVFLDVPWKNGDKYRDFEQSNYTLGDLLLKDLVNMIFTNNSNTSIIALKLPTMYDESEFSGEWKVITHMYNKYKMFVLIRNPSFTGGDLNDSDESGLFEQITNLSEQPDAFTTNEVEPVPEKSEEEIRFDNIVKDEMEYPTSDTNVKKIVINESVWTPKEIEEESSWVPSEESETNIINNKDEIELEEMDDDDMEIMSRKED
jgi:DNA-directed RNA polymerase II subunit RPB2